MDIRLENLGAKHVASVEFYMMVLASLYFLFNHDARIAYDIREEYDYRLTLRSRT